MARAVGFLARRDHSPQELARKLGRHSTDAAEIEQVIARLQAQGLLSEASFASSLVRRRAPGKGTARVLQELRQHGVSAAALEEARETLANTETERAQEAWQKRFGQPAATPQDRLKQMRFLAGRGFGHDVIRRVVPAAAAPESDDDEAWPGGSQDAG
ncbi:MAG: recombination regulator RecX [Pigmentiphaga sp.]|nr:recombination regulator RecX [Pigmentiphaga sp.]